MNVKTGIRQLAGFDPISLAADVAHAISGQGLFLAWLSFWWSGPRASLSAETLASGWVRG